MRRITTVSRRYSRHLLDALMSLFALELVSPAPEIYLVSAWVTDIELLDNNFGQYRALLPEASGTQVRLSSLLNTLADRGIAIHVALRDDEINDDFITRLNRPPIHVKTSDDLHAKILLTAHFCWEGSMNFTYSGVHKNPESVTLSTDPTHISQALLNIKQLWETLG
jgi:hypothetical protein